MTLSYGVSALANIFLPLPEEYQKRFIAQFRDMVAVTGENEAFMYVVNVIAPYLSHHSWDERLKDFFGCPAQNGQPEVHGFFEKYINTLKTVIMEADYRSFDRDYFDKALSAPTDSGQIRGTIEASISIIENWYKQGWYNDSEYRSKDAFSSPN